MAGADLRQSEERSSPWVEPALQHRLETGHHHLGVAARDRHQPGGGDVPGHNGDMGIGRRIGPAAANAAPADVSAVSDSRKSSMETAPSPVPNT